MPEPILIHYRARRIFTADADSPWAESLLIRGDTVVFAGTTAEAEHRIEQHARTVDLGDQLILPGIVEAHSHLVNLGRSLDQVDLLSAVNLEDVQQRVREAATQNPDAPRILGRSWLLDPLRGAQPDRHMLDAAVPDRPVYLVSNDLHSGWVNTAALRELGITADTPDPEGGTIVRDEQGDATGLLLETAALVVMRGGIERLEDNSVRDAAIRRALESYRAAGVTAAADLGLRQAELAALERAWDAGELALPVAGYLRVETSVDPATVQAQLREAISTRARISAKATAKGEVDPMLRISGIKLWIDGVIDSGTAAMLAPFAGGAHPAALWRRDLLESLVVAADAAGVQVAMHAIGDAAVELGLDAVAAARHANGESGIWHRLEHLEVVDPRSVARLAQLGVVASIQPVHCDPLVQGAWRAQLGDERVDRGFPWAELAAAGARIALGTDAPTAPFAPLPNLFIAATRRSPGHPELPANRPEQHLSLERALAAATRDAAASCGWGDSRGVLAAGRRADFIALAADPFAAGAEALQAASPTLTVVGGVEYPPVEHAKGGHLHE